MISDRAKLAGILAAGLGLRLLFLRVHQTIERPPPPGLRLVHQTDEFPQRRVRVLAVVPS